MNCIEIKIQTKVKVRKYEVDTLKLSKLLHSKRKPVEEVADYMQVPITLAEHWFRKDKYFSIPLPEHWNKLKEYLGIDTDEFDKAIMTFEIKDGEFDMSNRAYDSNGLCPTLQASSIPNVLTR